MNPGGLIGETPRMKEIFELVRKVAPTNCPVLVRGEPGTGKMRIAQAIRELSQRSKEFWSVINCAALPEELLEWELFGHRRVASTGEVETSVGAIESANGGTLILTEIETLPPSVQVRLLYFLQNKTFERVGSTKSRESDVRIIATSTGDLHEWIKVGKFREDLYYRLGVISFEIPPLRERIEDVPILAEAFLEESSVKFGVSSPGFDSKAIELMMNYSWPGNILELKNQITRAFLFNFPSPNPTPIGIHDLDIPPSKVSSVSAKQNSLAGLSDLEVLFGKTTSSVLARWDFDKSSG
jgi:DNA-binding NtrC family response regulator